MGVRGGADGRGAVGRVFGAVLGSTTPAPLWLLLPVVGVGCADGSERSESSSDDASDADDDGGGTGSSSRSAAGSAGARVPGRARLLTVVLFATAAFDVAFEVGAALRLWKGVGLVT